MSDLDKSVTRPAIGREKDVGVGQLTTKIVRSSILLPQRSRRTASNPGTEAAAMTVTIGPRDMDPPSYLVRVKSVKLGRTKHSPDNAAPYRSPRYISRSDIIQGIDAGHRLDARTIGDDVPIEIGASNAQKANNSAHHFADRL